MAVLLSTVEVNAMSLKDALQSKELSLDFDRGGTIWCGYTNTNNRVPDPVHVNKKDYLFDNNTYFIPSNTLPIVTNTEGGGSNNIYSVLASIKGNCNISLQYLPTNSKVSDSISFSGNNSKYTGTLYLHPGINNLMFSNENSVISSINVPDTIINNGKDKDTKPFVKTNDFKLISLYLPDNSKFGKLNINGKLTVSLLNKHNKQTYLTFTEINKSSQYSLAVHDKIDLRIDKYNHSKKKLLRDINITDGSNNQKQSNNSNTIQQVAPPVSIKDQIISELKKYIDVQIKNLNKTLNQNTSNNSELSTTVDGLKRTVASNTTDIISLNKVICGNEMLSYDNEKNIDKRITGLDGTVGDEENGLVKDVNVLKTNIGNDINTINNNITTINSTTGNLSTNINALKTAVGEVGDKSLQEQIGNTEGKNPLQDQITTLNNQINNEENGLVKDVSELKINIGNDINTINDNITAINTTIGKDDTEGLKSKIKTIENNIGTIPEDKDDLQTQIITLDNQINNEENGVVKDVNVLKTNIGNDIDTINNNIKEIKEKTIGEDDTKGLRKRIKTVEDSIGTVKTEEGGSIVPLQDQIDTINDSDTEGTLANKIKVLENKVGDTADKGELQTQIDTINSTVGKEDDSDGLRKRIKTVEDNIGTIKTITEGESTSIVPLQKQIDTINIAIGEDDTKGLRKRIKTVEDSIGTIDETKLVDLMKNNTDIQIITIPLVRYSSYLKFEEGHVDARKRLWSLCCTTCNDVLCKLEVSGVKTYDRSVTTIGYDGTINDLVLQVNSNCAYIPTCNNSQCTSKGKSHTYTKIDQTDISKYNDYISTHNCVYTGIGSNGYIGTYDLYCNKCGYHTPSIIRNDLLTTGQKILNEFKKNNNNLETCTKCKTTFDDNTFANTIKQATIDFYPFEHKFAYCNFKTHSYSCICIIRNCYPIEKGYPNFTNNPEDYIQAIKKYYIGKTCTGGIQYWDETTPEDGCGARWVNAIYYGQDHKFHYIDVDDCCIQSE